MDFFPDYTSRGNLRPHVVGASASSTIIDDEARSLIEDAKLFICRDDLMLLEVIGQGQTIYIYKKKLYEYFLLLYY